MAVLLEYGCLAGGSQRLRHISESDVNKLKCKSRSPTVCMEGNSFRNAAGLLATAMLVTAFPSMGTSADPIEAQSQQVLSAPGGDVEKLIEFLDQIRTGVTRSDEILLSENFLLTGRRSDIWKLWDPTLNEQMPETMPEAMPEPCWGEFTLVQKEGMRRFETEVKWCGTGPKSGLGKSYRLLNGEGAYKLDQNYLEISGIKDPNGKWQGLASQYFFLEDAGDLSDRLTLAGTCESIAGRLKDLSGNSEYWQRNKVRCRRDGELLVIDLEERNPDPSDPYKWHNAFWIDPGRGFRLKKKIMEQRTTEGGIDSREECQLEHTEVSPGLFVITKASLLARIGGNKQTKGWRKFDFIVDDFKSHDFPFDERLFDTKSLPVPIGTTVLDHRYDPARQFTYGKDPVDEEKLLAARGRGRRTLSFMLFVVNGALLLAVLVWLTWKLLVKPKARG